MIKGNIIWLNGCSSAGKSTLVKILQKHLKTPYFCIAQDTFTDIISPWCDGNFNGIEADQLWYDSIEAIYHTIKLYSDLGKNSIIDHVVINQKDGKEQEYFDKAMKLLEGYPLTLVRVNCSLDELKRREIERGDCEIGNAEWQLNMGLYLQGGYTCEVDTSKDSMDECAKQILGYIDVK